MKSTIPKKPIIISAILLCITLLGFLYFYRGIDSKNKESQQMETAWQTEALRREEIRTLDNSIKAIEPERAALDTHFAQSSDVVPFLDTLEALAPRASVKTEVTSVDIATDHSGLLVGLKATGSFEGLYKFLNLLENSPYELDFVSMDFQQDQINATNKTPQAQNWSMVLNVKLISFVQ